jgi:RNA polymerase sigma factor (sigma-70 family)
MPAAATHIRTLGVREASATVPRGRTALDQPNRDPAIAQAVASARSGDREAIRVLHARYEDNIYGYVLSMTRDQHGAEDVTRHVFLKLTSVIHEYDPRQAPFTSWLLRVARDVALDHLRQPRSVPCEPLQQADDSAREQALEALSDEQRNVTVLRHLVGLTPGEKSELMDSDRAPTRAPLFSDRERVSAAGNGGYGTGN